MSECKHEISEIIDDGGTCKRCGEWHSWRFWYGLQQVRIAELEEDVRIANHNLDRVEKWQDEVVEVYPIVAAHISRLLER